MDSQLSLSAQIAALCRSGFCHFRLLHPPVQLLTQHALKTLVHAFLHAAVVWHGQQLVAKDTVCTERRRMYSN